MPHKDRDDPVSLAPLTPEEALRALLVVKPDEAPEGEGDQLSGAVNHSEATSRPDPESI